MDYHGQGYPNMYGPGGNYAGGGSPNQFMNSTPQNFNPNGPMDNWSGIPPNYPSYGPPTHPPNYNAYGSPPAPPNFNSYGGPPVPPQYNQYGGGFPTPPNYASSFGSPTPSAPPSYNAYGNPPPTNYNPSLIHSVPSNHGSYSNQYGGIGQSPNVHPPKGGAFINKLEKLLHVDLNHDGTIGGKPNNSSRHKH